MVSRNWRVASTAAQVGCRSADAGGVAAGGSRQFAVNMTDFDAGLHIRYPRRRMVSEVILDENPSTFPAEPRRSPRRSNRYSDRPITRVRFSWASAAALPRREGGLRDPRVPAACTREALGPRLYSWRLDG